MPNRSEVVKRRRLGAAQERVANIRIKRLNNLEEQGDPLLDSDDKEAILQMELDNPDEAWERVDAERARKISSELTRRYFGSDGERAPPLGMFQGVLVFMVYPPTPAEYLRPISKLMQGVKQEYEEDSVKGTTAKHLSLDGPLDSTESWSTFDAMSKAIDLWNARRDESVSKTMARLGTNKAAATSRKTSRKTDGEDLNWDFIMEEWARHDDLENTLAKLSQFELCRNKYVYLIDADVLFAFLHVRTFSLEKEVIAY